MITQLGLEHVDTLGNTIEQIANAKAGIMKPDKPVLVSQQSFPGAYDALEVEANRRGALLVSANQRALVEGRGTVLHSRSDTANEDTRIRTECMVHLQLGSSIGGKNGMTINNVHLGIAGLHQCDNAATAVAILDCLHSNDLISSDYNIKQVIRDGLANAQLTGRLDSVRFDNCLYILDGAHTASAAAALQGTLQQMDLHKFFLLVAMSADKDSDGFMAAIQQLPWLMGVVCTEVEVKGSHERSMHATKLASAARTAGIDADCIEVVPEFVSAVSIVHKRANASKDASVCVTGSMHAVAAFYDHFYQK